MSITISALRAVNSELHLFCCIKTDILSFDALLKKIVTNLYKGEQVADSRKAKQVESLYRSAS
jgi:hypothetical protein